MQQKIERMQEGVSLAQGEKKHLAGQQLTPRYEVVQQLKDARKAHDTGSVSGACGNEKV